jgi:hypothetical protein
MRDLGEGSFVSTGFFAAFAMAPSLVYVIAIRIGE